MVLSNCLLMGITFVVQNVKCVCVFTRFSLMVIEFVAGILD